MFVHLHAGHTPKIAKMLIDRRADVNILDENKYSPLAYAIYLGEIYSFSLILKTYACMH